uniref:Uncharacterized protein n=1 Tax=Cannabis sativa TaxID=3483 RepID=A0A803PAF2_CANSA
MIGFLLRSKEDEKLATHLGPRPRNARMKTPMVTQHSSMGDHDPVTVDRGSFKLCTDAATDYKRRKLGLRAVVKDDYDNIIAGLAIPISGLLDSAHAEALTLNFHYKNNGYH